MEPRIKTSCNAVKQRPKITSFLNKYNHDKNIQSCLLQLADLANNTTDMATFYPKFAAVINTLFTVSNFFIVLNDDQQQLSLAYQHSTQENALLAQLNHHQWLESLTGIVFLNKKLLHCNAKQQADLAKTKHIILHDSLSYDWLGTPLKQGKLVIGVLALQSDSNDFTFKTREIELLQFITIHIVSAITLAQKNIRLHTQKLQQINNRLQDEICNRQKATKFQKALLTLAEITVNTVDLKTFYSALHHCLNNLVNAKSCYIALVCDQDKNLQFPLYVNEKIIFNETKERELALAKIVLNYSKPTLITTHTIFLLNDDNTIDEHPFKTNYREANAPMPKAYLGVPLIIQDKIKGVLAIQHPHNANIYQKSDLALMRFIGQHIAKAIAQKTEQSRRQQNHDDLEKLVLQRTQALQKSNTALKRQIAKRSKAEERLYFSTQHDNLTKLPNRALFSKRLEQALKQLKHNTRQQLAVLLINLDQFKIINDTLGYDAGNLFLIEISSRLKKCVTNIDDVARLEGDEFIILLDAIQNQQEIEEIATQIALEIETPFKFKDHTVYSSASIGIVNCHNRYANTNSVLRDANSAMYNAKNLGKGRYLFFDDNMRTQLLASMTLEQELRIAIKRQQFELHFQRIADLSKTQTIGFEALIRWDHPTKGFLTPDHFLPIAEELGLIVDIDLWVIQQVFQQFSLWENSAEFGNSLISINLSPRHLNHAKRLTELISLITDNKDNTHYSERLIIEFNERAFCQQKHDISLKNVKKLKSCGIKLALDNYGAGISSMNLLSDYPFEFIKLDRTFIHSLNVSDKNVPLIEALCRLGEQFGYRIIAEGIENKDVLAKVYAAGCEFGQGYLISRPAKIDNTLTDNIEATNCA